MSITLQTIKFERGKMVNIKGVWEVSMLEKKVSY